MPVKIWEWDDLHRIAFGALDDDREPEPQLAKPDRHRIQVDAENRSCQHPPPDLGNRAGLTRIEAQRSNSFEDVNEKRTGAAGRIEHSNTAQTFYL